MSENHKAPEESPSHKPSGEKPSIVPFPRLFAVLGFTIFSLILIAALLETASWCLLSFYRNDWHSPLRTLQAAPAGRRYACRGTGNGSCPVFAPPEANFRSASPAYDGYPWAEEFWKEERAYFRSRSAPPPYAPFRVWGMEKTHGKYINADDTEMGRVRRTVNKLQPGCAPESAVKVWFLGGSTAWGRGVPDFATIPSYLSEKLNAQEPRCVEVTNLGVEGYDASQELIYLIQELKAGHRPNLVILYDGYNDSYVGAFDPASPGTHFDLRQISSKFESTWISWPSVAQRSYAVQLLAAAESRLSGSNKLRPSSQKLHSLASLTLDSYEKNLDLVRTLAKNYGFEVYPFWQPALVFGEKPLDPFEKVAADRAPAVRTAIREVYQEAERRSEGSKSFVFLGRLFDPINEPLYIDEVHLGPRGNALVADAIAKELSSSPLLQPAAKGLAKPQE